MEMFLMIAAMSLLGVGVCAALFAAATHDVRQAERQADQPAQNVPQFFAPDVQAPPQRVPIEALLLQIERHVRLEQAAAESFHYAPTPESLHSRSASPLVH